MNFDVKFAARSAEARNFFPRHRSRKNVSDSSGFCKFAAYCFFDMETILAVIFGEFVD